MNKKSKISLIIAIITILVILSGLIVYAAQTINGKTFSKYGGDYYTAFGDGKCTNFGSLKHNDLANNYYDASSTNDYRDYVVGSKDVYCLNERSGTSSQCFYVADIIDIDGNKLTFNKSGKTEYGGAETLRMASAVYLKYAQTNKYDVGNGHSNEENMRHWITTGGGWKNFYDKYKGNINDQNVQSSYGNSEAATYNSYVDKAIEKYVGYDYVKNGTNFGELKDNNTTTPLATTGTYNISGQNYNTKIGPYSLQLNDANVEVEVTSAGNKYEGIVKKESGYYYFYLKEQLTVAPTQIKVKQSHKGIKARLIVLGTGSNQARLIARAYLTDVSNELPIKTMPLCEIDVSLQKYITKINDTDLQNGDTNLLDRKNAYTRADESQESSKKVSSESEQNKMQANTYKRANTVKVEKNDTVTYRIHVYNNSDVVANTIVLRDTFLYDDETKAQYGDYELVTITRDGTANDIKSDWKTVSGTSEKEYTIRNLAKGAETYFDVTVKIKDYEKGKVLDNTAYIANTVPQNKTEYRTSDTDYIELVQYSSKAEKHIESIQENDAKVEISREGLNAEMSAADPVLIEKGDTVTYKIKVTNTSDVETNVYVKDTISGFNYDNLDVSDWEYGNGEGSLSKLSGTGSELNANGKMSAGSTASCTVSMRVTEIGEDEVGTNTVKAWTEKHDEPDTPDNPNNPVPEIPEYFEEKKYLASLHKIVSSVNAQDRSTNTGVSNTRWDSWESKENVDNKSNKVYDKHNNPVVVGNGDTVTYTIRVKNDGTRLEDVQTEVSSLTSQKETLKTTLLGLIEQIRIGKITEENTTYKNTLQQYKEVSEQLNALLETCTTFTITEIEETLPNGVDFVSCSEGQYNNGVISGLNLTLVPREEKEITVTVNVTEPNMSINVLKNEAKIKTIVNENNLNVDDSTPDNNNDADYIQLKDIEIKGIVWNDKSLNKLQDNYNGTFDDDQEEGLPGIKVYLYRGDNAIATTTTGENGKYVFNADMIDKSIVTHACEQHIKAPYQCTETGYTSGSHQANYWKADSYYSYYIVFEYDGITYTSTIFADVTSTNSSDSNAKEDNKNGKIKETRDKFNARFTTINNASGIEYTTKNEENYIPQSNHVYNEKTMAMQSSTNIINIKDASEEILQHVNLGLRGRDIFDLELTSDVKEIKVTVNGQVGVYEYSNKVKLRRSDIKIDDLPKDEDMANKVSELDDAVAKKAVVDGHTQDVRDQELEASKKAVVNGKTVNKYDDTQGLQEILVTYQITVKNASRTAGKATQIINYYDNRYTPVVPEGQTYLDGPSGEKYNSVIIPTNGQETVDVTYSLNVPRKTLEDLLTKSDPIPTFNMAELYEYTTSVGEGQTEYTRGLIDKDSAPGSAATETARLVQGTTTKTTVEYYFTDDIGNLKYEDDTYATPTLYFGIPVENNTRTLTGTVFRDNATVNADKIKTGNGVQDQGEVGVYGATVELVELNEIKTPEEIAEGEGIVRYQTTTDKDGKFSFENFLPGNYIVRYRYGDTKNTLVAHQLEGTNINDYSYNGEDYQSTNNIGTHDAKQLNTTSKIWYTYNEKERISTGTDNLSRRQQVSTNVIGFDDPTMDALNDLRDRKDIQEATLNTIKDATKMYASTPNFTLTVEKTETDTENKNPAQKTAFSEYTVEEMNFGIAEVPITTIDLQKHVKGFTIKDSAGDNTIVEVTRNADEAGTVKEWKVKGNVLPGEKEGKTILDTSIEDDKLQGARLEVTYEVSTKIDIQKDFRTGEGVEPTITNIADFIDNDLSYNENLGENKNYWEVKTSEDVKGALETYHDANTAIGATPSGTIDPDHKLYTSKLFAKEGNYILAKNGGNCDLVLEKTLSSQDVTVGDIITSSIDTYEYNNNVEILGLTYKNTEDSTGFVYRDRVRRPDKYIILPGTRHDSATSETITIHPPTGDTSINTIYYIIGAAGLMVLAVGAFGIKKFVVDKK